MGSAGGETIQIDMESEKDISFPMLFPVKNSVYNFDIRENKWNCVKYICTRLGTGNVMVPRSKVKYTHRNSLETKE